MIIQRPRMIIQRPQIAKQRPNGAVQRLNEAKETVQLGGIERLEIKPCDFS